VEGCGVELLSVMMAGKVAPGEQFRSHLRYRRSGVRYSGRFIQA
jgi:hypothetical protein